MHVDPRGTPRPPRLLRLLVRILIRGRDAPYIVADLEASFARDVERGMGRGRAARRYARNVIGSAWSVGSSGLRAFVAQGVGLDARLGLRMLVKQPLVTVVAGLALGLGIPGSLTLVHAFDVIYGDLPIPESDRVLGIRHYDVDRQRPVLSTLQDYERWTELTSFESVAAVRSRSVDVNLGVAGAAPVAAAQVTASAFGVLGARPLHGRVFDADDERDGAAAVVLLGESLWSARFGRDPDIVGTSIRVGRASHTVVGVMPADFQFPRGHQVWLPFGARALDYPPGAGPSAFVFGRLADGVAVEDAETEMARLTERRASDDPERLERLVGELVGMPFLLLNDDEAIWGREDLGLIQILIFGLLLVVCGNVGTLILARTAQRSSEITIRAALGASRTRILTQLFVETLVLGLAATGIGLLGANALASRAPLLLRLDWLPYWADLTLTPGIVAIALGLTALCAVVAGVLPVLATTRRAIHANLQSTGARSGSAGLGVATSVLIVSQIVLSVGFLAVGAARTRSSWLYEGTHLGFDPDRYVVGTLTVPELDPVDSPTALDTAAWVRRVRATQRALLARLSEAPSVLGVGMAVHTPGAYPPDEDVILETPLLGFRQAEWDIATLRVDVSFFSGLNRPILAGRDFNAGDVEGPPGTRHTVVIVNESFVEHVLGGRGAVGQRFRYRRTATQRDTGDEEEWYEVVGVVGAFGANPQNSARDAGVYHPIAPGDVNPIRYAVEVAGDPDAFLPGLRQRAASVDPEATMDVALLGSTLGKGVLGPFLMIFAAAAFLLSATGLYALLSFTVSRRTREIGIRTALGAGTADIVSAVARRAILQVGVGLVLGVGWGWVLLDGQRNQRTFEAGNIPLTLVLTATVAGLVCALACTRPLRRGLRLKPTEALRES